MPAIFGPLRSPMYRGRVVALAVGLILAAGCIAKSNKRQSSGGGATAVTVTTDANGIQTAPLKASADATQNVTVPDDSSLAGTSISFPPGSLAIDTTISVQEGASITTEVGSEFGVVDSVVASGTPVVIESTAAADASAPFTVALGVPLVSGLALDETMHLVVFFKVVKASLGKTVVGVVPPTELNVADGTLNFSTTFFGHFQAAYVKAAVADRLEVETKAPIVTKIESQELPQVTLTSSSLAVVAPGVEWSVTGANFRPSLGAMIDGKKAQLIAVDSSTTARFRAPGVGFGKTKLVVFQDGAVSELDIVTRGKTDRPLITREPNEVCEGVKYYDLAGNDVVGTRTCRPGAGAPNCSSDGQTGCVATTAFKAASSTRLVPGNIKTGVAIGAVAGAVVPQPAACTTDGQANCLVSGSFKSVVAANVTPGILKRGVVIAAVTGAFPSAGYPLPRYTSSSGTTTATAGSDEPDLINVASSMTSDAAFEFWDASGKRYQGSGDADLVAANVKHGVNFENVALTGSWIGANVLSLWNIRAGVNRGDGHLGKLRTNCRNTVASGTYNYDGAVGSLPNTAINTGSALDIWDTIDDGSGQPNHTNVPAGWSSGVHFCGGVESTPGDDAVWRDVTTTTPPCNATNCRFQDKITQLEWSKKIAASRTWPQAVQDCDAYAGDGRTDWRLPTQKEAMTAYDHGIGSAANANWITTGDLATVFWTATTHALANSSAVYFKFSNAYSTYIAKTTQFNVVCVR